jgi:hypothetical protein
MQVMQIMQGAIICYKVEEPQRFSFRPTDVGVRASPQPTGLHQGLVAVDGNAPAVGWGDEGTPTLCVMYGMQGFIPYPCLRPGSG